MIGKKAQESRNDMALMYGLCLMLVIVAVGTMYELGVLGEIKDRLGEPNQITGAAVDELPEEKLALLNETIELVDPNE